jgi:hypothetical protein
MTTRRPESLRAENMQLVPARPDECQRCGACCATFRVSFHWLEAADAGLPDACVERLTPARVCLAGTNAKAPRCVALRGALGERVTCAVYAQRPTPCRELEIGDDKCNRARARHGLPPVAPPESTVSRP